MSVAGTHLQRRAPAAPRGARPRAAWLVAVCTVVVGTAGRLPADDREAFFERHVRPLLVERCHRCHAGDKAGGGLSLETREGTRRGGDGGAAVVPGRPDESLLLTAVSGADPNWRMPPEDAGPPLTPAEVGRLREWIAAGAIDPRDEAARIGGMRATEAATWWAFQPLGAATGLPSPDAIDALLDGPLAADGLDAAPPADDHTFIRRATYDLIGLPPSPAEVEAFAADQAADKDARLVARLLDEPDHGVHQGRRWLDVVRYADTAGENTDRPLPHAWRYRNWVFDAFSRDLPYPDLVRLQIAGDIMAASADRPARDEGIVATGYLAIARRFGHDIDKDVHLMHEDVIDNLGKNFLGITIGCARCHDHKYDPVSAQDYYALAGIFASTTFSFPGCEPKGQPRDLVPLTMTPTQAAAVATWRAKTAEREAERARRETITSRATLAALARSGGRVLGEGMVAEGQSVPLAARGENGPDGPIEVELAAGQVLMLAVAAGGNHGADSTLVEWTISDMAGSAAWSTAGIVPGIAAGNPLEDRGAAWCFLEQNRDGPAFLTDRQEAVDGRPALKAWRTGELPSVFANTTSAPVTVWTTLPGESLFVHPGPDRAAVLAWICPRDGRYRLGGRVADAHPSGLDGVAFTLTLAGDGTFGRALAEAGRLAATPLPDPGPEPTVPLAYAAVEGRPHDVPLQQRGEPEKPGEVVPRRWLEVFGGTAVPTGAGSGRRELAEWIATSPLAARVIVNRVWQWHFGAGLVRTPNDFGARGERPTHPELLEMLAAGFVAEGGRLKPLHRAIMATRAYRRGSVASPAVVAADPGNRLLARFDRRRLTAEEMRDSLLAASGDLDRSPGAGHPFPPESTWKFTQHAPFSAVYDTTRRSAFLMVQRQRRHPFLALFDGADPNASTPVRQTTTVPTQALYFLNDPFFHDRAAGLARRLLSVPDEAARIVAGYSIAFQRPPSPAEADRAARFITAYPGNADDRWAAWARVLLASNEFLHVD